MNSAEIRRRFLAFFERRGHAVIPSASLVTPDEKGTTNATLFNSAGMQPLVPFLLGKAHPAGKRLVNVQKCIRTSDIDDTGDKTHATFFEMLGNWSLGDYFKQDAITWSYEFLTSTEEGLGLDPNRLYVTVFEGDAAAPRDTEAAAIWREIFKKNRIDAGGDTTQGEAGRIFYMPAKNNWWEAGDNGPCGPDTEMFYDASNKFAGRTITHAEYVTADDVRDVIEIWNDVFMQYEKKDGKIVGKLPRPSVDTGAGLERLTMALQGVDTIYDTDLLKPVMDLMAKAPNDIRNKRIIADHLRASMFLIADGVTPSNTDRGYILRRLIRRAIINTTDRKLDENRISKYVDTLAGIYNETYPEFKNKLESIKKVLNEESLKFAQTLRFMETSEFTQEIIKLAQIKVVGNESTAEVDAGKIFDFHQSNGIPIDLIFEEINKVSKSVRSIPIPLEVESYFKKLINQKILAHQSLSRAGAEQKFKGGLADHDDPMVLRYHTATHLLHQALHDVLGEGVGQKGSNITAERLRFDFSYGSKLTDEQKKRVEDIINEKIAAKLPMNQVIMPKAEAEKTGARRFFAEKYGDQISIYFVGEDLASAYSKEFCGGPHVRNTSELAGPEGKWKFKIQKEEAVSAGVRRIKAILV